MQYHVVAFLRHDVTGGALHCLQGGGRHRGETVGACLLPDVDERVSEGIGIRCARVKFLDLKEGFCVPRTRLDFLECVDQGRRDPAAILLCAHLVDDRAETGEASLNAGELVVDAAELLPVFV